MLQDEPDSLWCYFKNKVQLKYNIANKIGKDQTLLNFRLSSFIHL